MYQFSDSDTPDSDDGRRFKTESTRKKIDKSERNYPKKYRSPSPRRSNENSRRDRRRSRSRSPRRDRERATHKDARSRRYDDHPKSSRYSDESKKLKVEDNSKSKNEASSSSKSDRSKRKDNEDSSKKQKTNGKHENSDAKDIAEKESYGPPLPPTLLKTKDKIDKIEINNSCDKSSSEKKKVVNNGCDGPPETKEPIEEITPIKVIKEETIESYGPSLPPSLLTQTAEKPIKDLDVSNEKSSVDAPAERNNYIGPSLPPHLREKLANATVEIINCGIEEEDKEEEEEEVEETYGPLPPGMVQNSQAHIALEERALQMKIDTLAGPGDDTAKREEWMLELPAVRSANLGLGPRQFRAKPAPDMSDRSSWTETPEDKIKKQLGQKKEDVDIRKEAEVNEIRKRDEQQEKMIKKHKKNSRKDDKSLVEIHQSKLKDKKDEEGPGVRRPFSRDVDLKVNRFDDAQKKAILKKAQLLDTRFSSGQSKFL